MNIIKHLIYKFIIENKFKLLFLVLLSLSINFLKINVISFITANLVKTINDRSYNSTMKLYYYFVLVIISYLCLYNFYEHFQIKILSVVRYWIRQELVKYILLINNNKYSEINFTKLNSPIYRISNTIFYIFNSIISLFIPNLTMILIIFLYFIYKDYNIGIIFLIGNAIAITFFYWISKHIMEYNEIYEEQSVKSENYIIEILNNIDKIIFRGRVNNEIDYHNEICDNTTNSSIVFYSISNYYCFITSGIIIVMIFIIVYYLIKKYYSNNISATLFITLFTILLLYRDLIISTINKLPDLFEFTGKYNSVINTFNKMDYDKMDFDNVLNNNINTFKPNLMFDTIEYKNVNFKYKASNKYVLTNFNLKLNTNDKIIGIIGNSGNGKSTFAKLLIKLYDYDGDIYIDNYNIKNIDRHYLRNNILFVNQNSKLFDKKVIENILYGCDNHDECYEHLNIIMKYPKIMTIFKDIDIYNKHAGSAGENLSGGQRQIINIINGLITPSKIIILDEPTNGLDGELKNNILDIILYFKKHKKCIIIITHDKDMTKIFDETINI